MARRLPIYLLLDTSGSMSGEPIQAVETGVKTLISGLLGVPEARKHAWVSIITFADSAEQKIPLTPIVDFRVPKLEAKGQTAMGEALSRVVERLEHEVRKNTPEQKGDYMPLLYLLTDGQPNPPENFEPGLNKFKQQEHRFVHVIACAAGPNAEVATLKKITDDVVRLNTVNKEDIAKFFELVTYVSISASRPKQKNGDDESAIKQRIREIARQKINELNFSEKDFMY